MAAVPPTQATIAQARRTSVYPLTFTPIVQPKVWGCEWWHLADLDRTAGSDVPARSIISNGPLAGRDLHQVVTDHHDAVMGAAPLTESGNFPLLIKYLKANEHLSVQVHPDGDYVSRHPTCYLKTEAWYIVDAEPGAVIYKGLRDGVTMEQLAAAVADGSIESLLHAVPVKRGDFHYLPSGSCHALGAGITVAEVQTPSDTTFRLYDWGRAGRRLHVREALDCIRLEIPPAAPPRPCDFGEMLLDGEHFCIERLIARPGEKRPLDRSDLPIVWMIIEGTGRIICRGTPCDELAFAAGMTLLLPASAGPRSAGDEAFALFNDDTVYLQITPSRGIRGNQPNHSSASPAPGSV